ncbi:MAG: aminotransferase, partial [Oscillospiraceae bacterium]|nr:aminotransferase [Oscillospiraceae bacterium]
KISEAYLAKGITVFERVRASIYSKRIVDTLGIPGAIRVSPLHCHGREEIDEYLRITAEIAKAAGN